MPRFMSLRLLVIALFVFLFAIPAFAGTPTENSSVTIYYPNSDWKFVPNNILVDGKENVYLKALQILLEPNQLPEGCYDEFPKELQINKFVIEKNTANIELNENILDQLDQNLYSIPLMRDILCFNIFNFDKRINNIQFLSNGVPSIKFGSADRKKFFTKDDLSNVIKAPKIDIDFSQLKGKSTEEIRKIFMEAIAKETGSTVSAAATYKVCIDPGHGGTASGAVATYNGKTIYEKNLNLSIGLETQKDLLSWTGPTFDVYMTRTTDKDVALTERVNVANNNSVKCFVSIHNNTSTSSTTRGCTAIYPLNHDTTNSKGLAERVVSAISGMTSLPRHRDPYQDDFQVLRDTKMPATIVECGFMTNATDLSYLINNPVDIGHAIGTGISYYCQLY